MIWARTHLIPLTVNLTVNHPNDNSSLNPEPQNNHIIPLVPLVLRGVNIFSQELGAPTLRKEPGRWAQSSLEFKASIRVLGLRG